MQRCYFALISGFALGATLAAASPRDSFKSIGDAGSALQINISKSYQTRAGLDDSRQVQWRSAEMRCVSKDCFTKPVTEL